MTKKVTAILLALILGLSSMLTVFAEEVQNDAQTEAITESTADVTAKAGEDAVFSVKTIGEVRSFQWQVSKDGGKKWTDLNPKTYGATETLRIPVKENYDGYLYRCEVTFADYRVEHSAPAKLRLSKTVTFESEAVAGVKITVEAPEGALPEGTTMTVGTVNKDAVQNAVDKSAEFSGTVLAAADITFYANGAVVEPSAPIKVTMTSEAIAKAVNPVVVHIPTSAEELEKATAVPEKVDAEKELNAVKFEADQFSVYAVLQPGETGDDARLFVHFKQANGAEDIVIPVKKTDIGENFNMVLYDPGVGNLTGRQTFFGWTEVENYTEADTENGLSIDDVRTAVRTLLNAGVVEGQTVTYYPMLFDVYHVTYLDEDGAGIKSDAVLVKSGSTKSYTINEDYDPKSTDARFEGWGVATQNDDGKWVLEEGFTKYDNGTEVTFGAGNLTNDLVLRAFVPAGYWLIYKENGSGASFTPPDFYRGAVTVRPADPDRYGYTFGGWYLEPECTNAFTFGNVLTATTRVYAKWNPRTQAPYTVIIWTENIECNGYDFKEVVTVQNATVGQNTNVVSRNNGTSIRINGSTATNMNKSYTGFHVKEDPTNVEIKPEGTSVVNVYFDRTEYTFTFQANANGNFSWNGNLDAYWASDPLTTIHTVTRKFDQDISDIWTFTGSNNVSYPETNTNTSWYPTNSSTYTARITSMQRMPAENITFRLVHTSRDTRYFHYYVEVAEGQTGTRTFQNRQFVLYQDLPNDFNVVYYNDDFWNLRGFDRLAIAKSGDQVVNLNAGGNISWQNLNNNYGGNNNHLYFYYTRQQFVINYMDGRYYNGDGIEQDEANRGNLGQSPMIDFDASIASYGKGGANYYEPTDPNGKYVFAGWYADAACKTLYTFNKMPLDGATVYAKWIIKQYRVFLYPNATNKNQTGVGTNDPSFESGEQSTCFRIDYDEEIKKFQAYRDEYEIGGWYTDPSLASQYAFSFDSFSAKDDMVPKAYDRTESTERNYYGDVEEDINKDDADHNDRFWITRKLELYAKWRSKLIGTDGITVVYEAGDDGKFADNSKTFTDPLRYVDTAEAVAQGASTATTDGLEFKQWVLYEWNGTAFVPTETKVLPGKTFEVLASMAQIVDDSTGQPVTKEYVKQHTDGSYTYTIKLVAEYGSIEAPTPTYINWYRNWEGDTAQAGLLHEDKNIGINEAITIYTLVEGGQIPTRPGFTFKGWARETELDSTGAVIPFYANPEIYLKWVEATDEAAAHYEAKNGDEWVPVTEVAADENQPYHGMYAVWEANVFYVYHSSTGKLEAIDMSTLTEETYDLTAKVAEGSLYGGYYKTTPAVTEDAIAAAKKAALLATNLTAAVEGAEKYDGKSLKTSAGVKFWAKKNAYLETAGDEKGSAITPVKDAVYYLKEVPNIYLQTNARWIYDWNDGNKILNLYLLTVSDDALYQALNFAVAADSLNANVVSSFSYQQRNATGDPTEITPTTLINQRGYIGVADATTKISAIAAATESAPVVVYPSWKTYDGEVISTKGYKLWNKDGSGDLTKDNIGFAPVTGD